MDQGLEHFHRDRSTGVGNAQKGKADRRAGDDVGQVVPLPNAQTRDPLGAREHRAVSLQFAACPGSAQQITGALRQQRPLGGLYEKIGRAGLVGIGDRLIVIQAGKHQHRYLGAAMQAA